jgi:ornithine cyclodeaminase/alanine dehydrogenase-like protein (mu-crystallin family)
MTPTPLSGRTDIAELLTVDACPAAMEAVFRAHVTGQTLPPAVQGVGALFDAANGALPGLMDSVEITGPRMAAATAIAACHLGSEHEIDPRVLAHAAIRRHGHGTPDCGRVAGYDKAPRLGRGETLDLGY